MADFSSASMADMAGAVTQSNLNAEIVTQTLDKMNQYGGKKSKGNLQNNMSNSYDFNKDVLSAAYEGKGTIADYSQG